MINRTCPIKSSEIRRSRFANDSGFSLVELIIVVSILAIAAVPLMKSMGMASRTNAKAQSIQNANNLAEAVMEDVKSSSIPDLVEAHGGFTDGECTYTETERSSAQNEYIVNVTISSKSYSGEAPAPISDPDEDPVEKSAFVLAANTMKLPAIEDIDTMSQAVLTASRELNKYDEAAQSYFNEKKKGYKPEEDATTRAKITSKIISIDKKCTIEGGHEVVKVNATVRYEGDSSAVGFERDLYSGAFISADTSGEEGYKSPDSNLYIFYKRNSNLPTEVADVIEITDKGGVSSPKNTTDSHRIYLIMQSDADPIPEITVTRKETTYTLDPDDLLDGDYLVEDTDVEFVTNISSHVYREKAKNRVYEIQVVLTKDGDSREYAHLDSTVTASDEIPVSDE